MSDQLSAFDLVFEGPVDDKPETIRRLKAAFLVDLNFPIERVQEILTQSPVVIVSSDSEMELLGYIDSLKQAGGNVCIVRKGETNKVEEDTDTSTIEFELEFDVEDGSTKVAQQSSSLFQLDNTEDTASREPKTYELPTESEELEDDPIIPAILTKQAVGPILNTQPILEEEPLDLTLAPPLDEPTHELTLGAPIEEEELVDSAISNQLLFDDGENYSEKLTESLQEVIEEHKQIAPEEVTAVSMVLQNLNSSLQFDDAAQTPETPPPPPVPKQPEVQATDALSSLAFDGPEDTQETKPQAAPITTKSVSPQPKQAQVQSEPAPVEEKPIIREALADPQLLKGKSKSPNAAPDPQRKKLNFSMGDVLIPILVGVPMVLIGNWFYYQQKPKTVVQYDEVAKALITTASKASSQKEAQKTDVQIPTEQTFIGRQEFSDRSLDADIGLNNDTKKITVTAKLETPEPPPLTPEQIGRREVAPPWIRKVELDPVRIEVTDSNTFSSVTPARFYIDKDGKTTRLVGSATISGTIDQTKGSVELHAVAVYGTKSKSETPSLVLNESGKFEISLGGTVTARHVKIKE